MANAERYTRSQLALFAYHKNRNLLLAAQVNMAVLMAVRGRLGEGEAMIADAANTSRQVQTSHLDSARIHLARARLERLRGRNAAAQASLTEALRLSEAAEANGYGGFDTVICLEDLASVLRLQKLKGEAKAVEHRLNARLNALLASGQRVRYAEEVVENR